MDPIKPEPIQRRKLSHQIEERLLAQIQAGDVMPGDSLPSERELMALYGVGRPAIREAMQNLERMGLIEIRTPAHVAKLREALEAHKALSRTSPDFLRLDGQFHLEIARVSGNPIFITLSEALFGWLANFHVHLVRSPGHEPVTLAEHTAILKAIEQGDPEAAARMMGDHLNRASALYRVEYVRQPSEP